MANFSWLNFLAPGVGSVIESAKNGNSAGSSTKDFFAGVFNPFHGASGSSDGSTSSVSNPVSDFLFGSGDSNSLTLNGLLGLGKNGSLSELGSSLGSGLGQGLSNGLSSFVDNLINGSFGDILKDANGDPDYTAAQAIGDLFTGGAVSANKETRLNNAWQREFSEDQRDYERAFAAEEQAYNRAFAEDERDYQRNTIDQFNMGIQNANLDLQRQSLAHQISMDEFNKDLALHGTSLAAQDAASVGINPLAMSGQVSPFGSSVGNAGSSSGVSSNGASPTSHSPGSASNPALGQLATFAPIQNAIASFVGLSQSQGRLLLDKDALQAQKDYNKGTLANQAYNSETDRLKTLIDAKKSGFKVNDALFANLSEDAFNSYHEQLRSFIRNTNQHTSSMKDATLLDRDNFNMLDSYNKVMEDLIGEEIKNASHDRKMKVWENANNSAGTLFDLVGDIVGGYGPMRNVRRLFRGR